MHATAMADELRTRRAYKPKASYAMNHNIHDDPQWRMMPCLYAVKPNAPYGLRWTHDPAYGPLTIQHRALYFNGRDSYESGRIESYPLFRVEVIDHGADPADGLRCVRQGHDELRAQARNLLISTPNNTAGL